MSRAEQDAAVRSTGFVQRAELARDVEDFLLRKRYPHSVARWGAHAVAAGRYNFQGQRRLSELVQRHRRTAQRARARLEADGLIKTYLLLPGQMVPGQRAPVTRYRVIRDTSTLVRRAARHMPKSLPKRTPSAAEPPAAPERVSPAEIIAFASGLGGGSEHQQRKAPPNAAVVTPDELADVERELAELERSKPPASERAPPRGPRAPA